MSGIFQKLLIQNKTRKKHFMNHILSWMIINHHKLTLSSNGTRVCQVLNQILWFDIWKYTHVHVSVSTNVHVCPLMACTWIYFQQPIALSLIFVSDWLIDSFTWWSIWTICRSDLSTPCPYYCYYCYCYCYWRWHDRRLHDAIVFFAQTLYIIQTVSHTP